MEKVTEYNFLRSNEYIDERGNNESLRVCYEGLSPRKHSKDYYFWTVTCRENIFHPEQFRRQMYNFFKSRGVKQNVLGTLEWYPTNSPLKRGLHAHCVTSQGQPPKQDHDSVWKVHVEKIPIFQEEGEKNAPNLCELSKVWDYINEDVQYTMSMVTRHMFEVINGLR